MLCFYICDAKGEKGAMGGDVILRYDVLNVDVIITCFRVMIISP